MADDPQTDREALVYLMQAFNIESWQCPKCGHDEDCATMDSAFFLRDYLANHPPRTDDAVIKEALSNEDAMEAEFEVWKDGIPVFSIRAVSSFARCEALQYAALYSSSGSVKVYEVTRKNGRTSRELFAPIKTANPSL